MVDWHFAINAIRSEISGAKANNQINIEIRKLELLINYIESDLAVLDRDAILEKINNPNAQYDKNIDHYIRYVKEQNQLHKQYTQLIISAGYAGYFGLWSISKGYIDPITAKWSFLLFCISLLSFLILEIFKIGLDGFGIHIKNQALLKAKIEDNYQRKNDHVNSANRYEDCLELWISRIWVISYPVSVITGIAAFLLLGFAVALDVFGIPQNLF